MPTLIAAVNPIGLTPAFLIPLSIDPPQHNGLLIQKLAPDGNIKAFENFEIEPNLIINLKDKSAAEAVQGGQGIWVFAFDATDIIVGRESGLALAEGQFDGQPFLAVEVAQFCDAEELYHRALSAAFDAHRKVSSLGSEIWRDIVILRPAILERNY